LETDSHSFVPPDDAAWRRGRELVTPWEQLVQPVFFGFERIPTDRPLMFVGNHTIYGMLDIPLLFVALVERGGVFPRALGHHMHFRVPIWREWLRSYGVVDGLADTTDRLLASGESVLVFPGGGREVSKRHGEKYKLIWKERLGFVRLALKNGATIVPFAEVGGEETLDIIFDGDQIAETPFGWPVRKGLISPELLFPLVRGIGITPLPRPVRMYFKIGRPLSTTSLSRAWEDETTQREVRSRVRVELERCIRFLLEVRENDPDRTFLARVNRWLQREPAATFLPAPDPGKPFRWETGDLAPKLPS